MTTNRREVVPNNAGGWEVRKPGAGRASVRVKTQSEAIARGRQILSNTGGGELQVRNRAGGIVVQDTISSRTQRRIFLSYAAADHALAEDIRKTLSRVGEVLVAPAGGEFRLPAAIDVAVLLVTRNALQSVFVGAEWAQAMAAASQVVPLVAPDVRQDRLPAFLRSFMALPIGGGHDDLLRRIAAIGPDQRRAQRLDYVADAAGLLTDAIDSARSTLSLAAHALDGVFRAVPARLGEAARRGVAVRVLLPDPAYFRSPEGGRNLEIASRADLSLNRLLHESAPGLQVRVTRVPMSQAMLSIDARAFVDPLPAAGAPRGFILLDDKGDTRTLYRAAAASFEAMYAAASPVGSIDGEGPLAAALPLPPEVSEQSVLRWLEGTGLLTDVVRAPDRSFDALGWDPHHGPTVVEIKRTQSPLGSNVIQQLIAHAAASGATNAILVSSAGFTLSAREVAARAIETVGIAIQLVAMPPSPSPESGDPAP